MAVTRSHSLSIGIVGLPNSGKSTIFNALTKSSVPAENYPFCTIDKNIGVVEIPDPRLAKLAKLLKSNKTIPAAIKFVDIAGLVKGAHKGEGLGNKFLGHIREVDTIMYVLRAFESENITHVHDKINPVDDLLVVRAELMLKDIDTVEKRLEEAQSTAKADNSDEAKLRVSMLEKLLKGLSNENPAYAIEFGVKAKKIVKELMLLTDKPAFYVLNVAGDIDQKQMEKWLSTLKENIPKKDHNFVITVDCKVEAELDTLGKEDRKAFVSEIKDYKGIKDIIRLAIDRLDLITFYTANEKEANARTIREGATAKEAAEVVHTDLATNFVSAEVLGIQELLDSGGWHQAKEKGKVRIESKDYVVQDGDRIIIHATK